MKIVRTSRIDERNLEQCLYLNLMNSSINRINTTYLYNVIVLVLCYTGICSLDTIPLVNLLYLNIAKTNIF